jgi:hypothetical protein
MIKIKLKDEFYQDLLDKIKESRREYRKEKDFELLDTLPDWAKDPKNLWVQTALNYQRKLEGWEKLCIEAYLCGWIDYFDIQVGGMPDADRTIYFKWQEDKKEKVASLEVYFKPGPKPLAPPPPPPTDSSTSLPKPPPPPYS